MILVAMSSVNGYAQTDQGKVSGTIRDQSTAFVAGGTVTVKNERTGEVRSGMSNDQGYFVGQPYDPYTLSFIDSLSLAARESLHQDRRRTPDDPHGNGPAGRDDVHTPERHRVPRQSALVDSVPCR